MLALNAGYANSTEVESPSENRLASEEALANDNVASGQSFVSSVESYNKFGNADVMFRLATPSRECAGYWITKDDRGYNANLSMILAAYQAKNPVVVYGLIAESEKWSGSETAHFCKLYAITYR
ncbi:hypothetical protein [Vibrio ostreicida]|nr:hypothetical protein [Vibrio ostreicida]